MTSAGALRLHRKMGKEAVGGGRLLTHTLVSILCRSMQEIAGGNVLGL